MKLSHVFILPLMFHVCFCLASSVHISGCDSKGTITVREINFTFTCTGIALSKGVEWRLFFNNGTRIPIGMCNSQNCWSNLTNVILQWKNGTVNELVILQFDTSWNDSLLECNEENNPAFGSCTIILLSTFSTTTLPSTRKSTETLSATSASLVNAESESSIFPNIPLLSTLHFAKLSGTLSTLSSTTSMLHISGCDSKGTITVREINFTFTCTGIAFSKAVEWALFFNNGTRIPIGMCNSQNCWRNLTNVNLQWKNGTVNELVILQFDTSWNDSLLECNEENNLSKASCKITLLIYPLRDSTFYLSTSEKTALSLSTDQHTVSSHLMMSSTATAEDLPSSPSRDLYWIIGCTVAALAVFIFIVFASVSNKRKQRRADDCYNRIDVMGNRIKPLRPNPMYDHITL